MSRHSKNNTANPVFTYAERQMVKDFGLQKQRIGVDSQKPFEHCTLCLSRVIDPMVCEKGHLFCRECIIENMIKQKKNNNALLDAYKEKVAIQQIKAQAEVEYQRQEKQNLFEQLDFNNDILQRKTVKQQTDQKLSGYLTEDKRQIQHVQEQLADKGKIMITNSKEDLTQKNFWIPEGNHFDEEVVGDAPKCLVICPASNDHQLKMKKLYKVHLFDGGNTKSEEVYCYACSKTLKFQKVAASKKCGHVMCKSCIERICMPDKKCMVCSKNFDKNDIVLLEEAKSAFVSHNPVEASKFTPKMLI